MQNTAKKMLKNMLFKILSGDHPIKLKSLVPLNNLVLVKCLLCGQYLYILNAFLNSIQMYEGFFGVL